VVEECLEGGLRAVQLREKDLAVRPLLELATSLRESTRRRQARLLINDRADVALAVKADGVQRTHQSLPVSAMRAIGGPRFVVGASVHSVEEAQTAATEGADFIVFGPIWDTPSKQPFGPPQGLEALRRVTAAVATPVLAIGGISAARVRDVLAAGAVGVAIISAILAAPRPAEATRAFVDALGRA
jgi:thiamine-phosphate pyrophosphorylase